LRKVVLWGLAERIWERLLLGKPSGRAASKGKEPGLELVLARESDFGRSPFSGGFLRRVPANAFLRRFVA